MSPLGRGNFVPGDYLPLTMDQAAQLQVYLTGLYQDINKTNFPDGLDTYLIAIGQVATVLALASALANPAQADGDAPGEEPT